MKKVVALLLTILTVISLTGCGQKYKYTYTLGPEANGIGVANDERILAIDEFFTLSLPEEATISISGKNIYEATEDGGIRLHYSADFNVYSVASHFYFTLMLRYVEVEDGVIRVYNRKDKEDIYSKFEYDENDVVTYENDWATITRYTQVNSIQPYANQHMYVYTIKDSINKDEFKWSHLSLFIYHQDESDDIPVDVLKAIEYLKVSTN